MCETCSSQVDLKSINKLDRETGSYLSGVPKGSSDRYADNIKMNFNVTRSFGCTFVYVVMQFLSYTINDGHDTSSLPTGARYIPYLAAVGWLMASRNRTTYCVLGCQKRNMGHRQPCL
jgi:hypothetical protein